MAANRFRRSIQELNFRFVKGEQQSGILLTFDFESLNASIASPNILFALETAKKKFKADAVYFRYFDDGRNAVPQVYLYDFTSQAPSQQQRNKIHVHMWNSSNIPLYIIVEKDTVRIFDSRSKPEQGTDLYASEIIKLAGSTLRDFDARFLDDGLFWEKGQNEEHFAFEQSATKDLIRGLKKVYADFQSNTGLNQHVALKLLVQCLLIKYLEERDENSETGYFATTYFQKHFQCSNFCDVIRSGKLLHLLDRLAVDFKGRIFDWDKESEGAERDSINSVNLNLLADYLDATIDDDQYVLWRLYSFSHLPIEVISSVYEELLTRSKDITYTPEMIVGMLVDECMPLRAPRNNFRLIDVSCGSGIFLVRAYKRLVQWWRYDQWQKTGILAKPSLRVLNDLLLLSIHGVDIHKDAVRLTVFSLALAMLDEVDLDPPTWGKLKFPDLSKNIVVEDFFKFSSDKENASSRYDLVIGNPPFNIPEVDGKEPNRTKYFRSLKSKYGYKSKTKIPDENPALHFLIQSISLLNPDAILCLVQPSGPLLYQKETEFKRFLFGRLTCLQVIDFTKLGDRLWGDKNIATAAIFLQNSEPKDNFDVVHIVANRTFSNCQRLFLEFDHYDFHRVDEDALLFNPYVWKANLLGGGRIGQFITKLDALPKLKTYLSKKKEDGWKVSMGFTVGNQTKEAAFITNHNYLDVKSFTEDGVLDDAIKPCPFERFERPRDKELFSPPLILIKAVVGREKIPLHYSHDYLTFKYGVLGISAPLESKKELDRLFDYLNNNNKLLRFFIAATSGRMMIGKATSINQEDLLRLPFPSDLAELPLNEAEQLLIEDVLNYHVGNFNPSVAPSSEQLYKYSNTFCRTLNTIYQKGKSAFQLKKILLTENYHVLHFEYSGKAITPSVESHGDLEEHLKSLIPSEGPKARTYHIQRILKIYGRDSIVLGKPSHLRYWLPSIAFRDADDTFAEYVAARYIHNA